MNRGKSLGQKVSECGEERGEDLGQRVQLVISVCGVWTGGTKPLRLSSKGSAGQISECGEEKGKGLGHRDQMVRSVSAVWTEARI